MPPFFHLLRFSDRLTANGKRVAAKIAVIKVCGDILVFVIDSRACAMLDLRPAHGHSSRTRQLIDRAELIETLPRLRRYARLLTGDRNRADDLVQDAIERALAREATFRDGSKLRPWLFSLMHNLFVDGTRSREAVDWSADTNELPEMAAPRSSDPAEMRDIHKALEKLPTEQREVLLLVAIEGLRYREAAEVLALPVGTVMSRLARAREKMQEILGGIPAGIGAGGTA